MVHPDFFFFFFEDSGRNHQMVRRWLTYNCDCEEMSQQNQVPNL